MGHCYLAYSILFQVIVDLCQSKPSPKFRYRSDIGKKRGNARSVSYCTNIKQYNIQARTLALSLEVSK